MELDEPQQRELLTLADAVDRGEDIQRNYLLPRRRDQKQLLDGDIDDWLSQLSSRKIGRKRTKKAQPMSKEDRDFGMNSLAQLVGSKRHLNIPRDRKMANVVSAQNYINSRNDKVKGKFTKSGAPEKSGFEGWEALQQDLDGDTIPENTVVDNNKNLRYVEGYRVGPRNQDAYKVFQKYYSENPSADSRKTTPYSEYMRMLRDQEGVATFMDIWKKVFDDYVDNNQLLAKTSKMVQNRVRMYFYKLFMYYVLRKYNLVKESDSLAQAVEKIKKVSKSGVIKDTILNKIYEIYNDDGAQQAFEEVLFKILDTKVPAVCQLLLREYTDGAKIQPEAIDNILFG
jgi:hypothetical protein